MDKEKQKNTLKTFLSREYKKLVNYAKMYFTERFFETDAEDIIQEVALNIYAKLEFDTPVENITAYFYRAIRNKIIDYQRKKRRNVSLENFKTDREEERLPVVQMDDISETEELFYQEELQDKVWDALARLNPDQQAIIVETELEGNTFESLSKRWGIPIGTLLSRKHRALNQLQKILNEQMKHV